MGRRYISGCRVGVCMGSDERLGDEIEETQKELLELSVRSLQLTVPCVRLRAERLLNEQEVEVKATEAHLLMEHIARLERDIANMVNALKSLHPNLGFI